MFGLLWRSSGTYIKNTTVHVVVKNHDWTRTYYYQKRCCYVGTCPQTWRRIYQTEIYRRKITIFLNKWTMSNWLFYIFTFYMHIKKVLCKDWNLFTTYNYYIIHISEENFWNILCWNYQTCPRNAENFSFLVGKRI